MMSSLQGTDAQGDGTFSGETGGIIKSFGNKMVNDNPDISTRYITYQQNNTSFDAYEASSRTEAVPSTVHTLVGGTTYNNFDTASTFYSYNLESADNCVNTVKKFAGRMNGGDFSWDFSDLSEDSDYAVNTEYKQALIAYKSGLVKVLAEKIESSNTGSDSNTGDSGSTGNNTPSISNSVIHNFANGMTSDVFTISANMKSGATPVTYEGTTYSSAIKMESATSITFTTTAKMTLILVTDGADGKRIKVDGEKYTATNGVFTVEIEAGTHTITKGDSINLYLIILN